MFDDVGSVLRVHTSESEMVVVEGGGEEVEGVEEGGG